MKTATEALAGRENAFLVLNASDLSVFFLPANFCSSDLKHKGFTLFRGLQAVVDWSGLQGVNFIR